MTRNLFDDEIEADLQQRDLLQRIQWTNSRNESDDPPPFNPELLNILRDPRTPEQPDPFELPQQDIGVLGTIGDYAGGLFTGPAKAANAALSGVLNIPDALVGGAFEEINRFRAMGSKEPLQAPDLSVDAPAIPTTPRATTGGRVIEGISQFIAGWTAIGKLGVLAKSSKAGATIPSIGELSFASMTAGYRNVVLRGAATDAFFFAGQEENLSNLIQHFPALQNPVTEYLASKDDNEAENRLKNAITGAFAGVALDGMVRTVGMVVQGIKHFKQTRALQRELDETADATNRILESDIARISSQRIDEQVRALVGDPNAPIIQVRSAAENRALVDATRGEVAFAPGARQRLSEEHASQFTEGMDIPPLQNVSVSDTLKAIRPSFVSQTLEGGRGIRHAISFDTEADRLAYIATSRTTKAIRDEATETLNRAGWNDDQIQRIGAAIREDFTNKTKVTSTPTRLRAEPTGQRIFGEAAEDFFASHAHTTASAVTRVAFGKGKFIDFNFAPFRFAASMEDGFKAMVSTFQKSPEVRTWLVDAAKSGELNQLQELYRRSPEQILASDEMIGLAALTKASWLRTSTFAALVKQPNATDAVRQEFSAAMMMHTFISNQWSKAGTEAGRALAARRRVVTDSETLQQFRNMQASLASVKGAEQVEAIAEAILAGAKSGDIVPATRMLETLEREGYSTKVLNTIREIWTNFILSGPKTFLTNALSPVAVASYTLGTRGLARVVGETADDALRVEQGELAASLYGFWKALPEAFEVARKAFIEGGLDTRYSFLGSRNTQEMMKHGMMQRRVSAEYWQLPTWSEIQSGIVDPSESIKATIGYGLNRIGSVINTVYKTQSSTDYFWKVAIYRSEIHAMAHRQAMQEVRAGSLAEGMFESRLAQLTDANSIPKEWIETAAESARRLTFTNDPDKWTQKLTNLRDYEHPANYSFFLIPFINTPANILKYSFGHAAGPLRLLSSSVRERIANGGPEAHTELAKIGMGTTMLLNGLDMVMKGNISGRGPTNPSERQALQRTGWQPYSIKIGNTWYQYNRFEPLGVLFGVVADFGEISVRAQDVGDEKDLMELAGGIVLASTSTVANKTYFSGLFEFIQAVADPDRYGDSPGYTSL